MNFAAKNASVPNAAREYDESCLSLGDRSFVAKVN